MALTLLALAGSPVTANAQGVQAAGAAGRAAFSRFTRIRPMTPAGRGAARGGAAAATAAAAAAGSRVMKSKAILSAAVAGSMSLLLFSSTISSMLDLCSRQSQLDLEEHTRQCTEFNNNVMTKGQHLDGSRDNKAYANSDQYAYKEFYRNLHERITTASPDNIQSLNSFITAVRLARVRASNWVNVTEYWCTKALSAFETCTEQYVFNVKDFYNRYCDWLKEPRMIYPAGPAQTQTMCVPVLPAAGDPPGTAGRLACQEVTIQGPAPEPLPPKPIRDPICDPDQRKAAAEIRYTKHSNLKKVDPPAK